MVKFTAKLKIFDIKKSQSFSDKPALLKHPFHTRFNCSEIYVHRNDLELIILDTEVCS